MHTVDVVLVCLVAVVVVLFAAILGRQRQMLRTRGAVPIAVARGHRWLYGIGRYVEGELRWYRAIGFGTRPSRVLRRGEVEVLHHREPFESERGSLPATAIVVECRTEGDIVRFAIGESAYTGFVSWLESSAPR